MEFENYLQKERNGNYIKSVEHFFESLPMLILTPNAIITHAGPIRNGATRREIIDIEDNPDYYHQLMWNRLHEFRGTPSLKEYDEQDLIKMRRKLQMGEDAFFIVGHNPMWHTGDKTGIWIDIIGIKNHIIIYSNKATQAPYLTIENGKLLSHFALNKKTERNHA